MSKKSFAGISIAVALGLGRGKAGNSYICLNTGTRQANVGYDFNDETH